MRNLLLPLTLLALVACRSMDDYVYPAAAIETVPEALELAPSGTALAYEEAFDPLPVVMVVLEGHPVRALIATRRDRHSIAPGAVPEGALVTGEATVPHQTPEGVEPIVREVVHIARVDVGGTTLEGLLMLVEPLPPGVDVLLSPQAFTGAVVTLDGPARELRVHAGSLPAPEERDSETVRLNLRFLMGACAADAPRFMATIVVVAASELDGPLMVGHSTSTVIDTARGPELLPAGVGAVEAQFTGSRKVRMDEVFGEDYPRARAREVEHLGSGWLVLGAQYLADHVLELEPERRFARLR